MKENCGNIPIVLFANKVDLVDENNIEKAKIQNFTKENNFLKFFFTSAKTALGVVEAFNAIIDHLYLKFK